MAVYSNKGPGLGSVGSYQMSGRPWLTGSDSMKGDITDRIKFPNVAKSVTVISNTAHDIYVHFAPGVVSITGSHYFPLTTAAEQATFNVRCREIYITTPAANAGNAASYSLIAELTGIPNYELTGTMSGSGVSSDHNDNYWSRATNY